MKQIRNRKDVESYYESTSLNQSSLKLLLKGRKEFLNKKEGKEKTYFNIGSALDCLVFEGEEVFSKNFYISGIDKPTESIKSIVDSVYEKTSSEPIVINIESGKEKIELGNYIKEVLSKEIEEQSYCSKMKMGTRIDRVLNNGGEEYLIHLRRSENKCILSKEEYEKVKSLEESLKTSNLVNTYFNNCDEELNSKDRHIFYYTQKPLYFKHKNVECKALLDMMIIDTENKVIELFDLKTTEGNPFKILDSIKKYRYDIQASWYTLALKYNYPFYYIKPFKFIVISKDNSYKPIICRLNDDILRIGLYGRDEIISDYIIEQNKKPHKVERHIVSKKVKGIEELMLEYKYYMSNGWEEEKYFSDSGGKIEVDWNETKFNWD